MAEFNLSEIENKQVQELLLARARAIQAYAGLEMSLATLFSQLLDSDPAAASLVFYRIVNTRSRNEIISSLLKHRHGSKFNLYSNSVFKRIRELDLTRNNLVHWHQWISVDVQAKQTSDATCVLRPPNIWSKSDETINSNKMELFKQECSFISHQLSIFCSHISGTPPLDPPWPDIFLQPVTYPPPEDYPLSPKNKEPSDQPPPSQA